MKKHRGSAESAVSKVHHAAVVRVEHNSLALLLAGLLTIWSIHDFIFQCTYCSFISFIRLKSYRYAFFPEKQISATFFDSASTPLAFYCLYHGGNCEKGKN